MISLIVGLIVVVTSIYFGLRFWQDVLVVLKGALPLLFLFGGLLAVIAGGTAIRDEAEAKKTEDDQNVESK